MEIVCLDLEGVLVPEIWIEFSRATGIPEFARTTRDEPDYDKLMHYRIDLLAKHGLGLAEIQIYYRDVGACFSKCERRAFTDSSGRPCNESLFPVQSHFFNDSHVYSPLIVVCLFNLLQ